jgi:hypothetical protein
MRSNFCLQPTLPRNLRGPESDTLRVRVSAAEARSVRRLDHVITNPTPLALAAARAAVDQLRQRGFRPVEEQYDPNNLGNVLLELASPELHLRFTRDRGQHFIDIRHSNEQEWFNEHTVLVLLGAKSEAEALVHSKWASAEDVAAAIDRHLDEIITAFNDRNYQQTRAQLHRIERERAAKQFGYHAPN